MRLTGFSVILIMLFALYGTAQAIDDNAGTSGAQFLKIDVGARPSGMGGAFTAVADDITSIAWNPAGLSDISINEISFMHNRLFDGEAAHNFAAYGHSFDEWGGFGLSYVDVSVSDIERRDINEMPGGEVDVSDRAVSLGYGAKVFAYCRLGITFRYIFQKLDEESANSFGGDLGALLGADDRPWQVGLAVQNIGTEVKFEEEGDPQPLTFRLGFSYRFFDDKLVTAVDVVKARDADFGGSFGVEYIIKKMIALRAGYRARPELDLSGMEGITAGAGIILGGIRDWSHFVGAIDYAYVPFAETLGDSHRFSLSLKF